MRNRRPPPSNSKTPRSQAIGLSAAPVGRDAVVEHDARLFGHTLAPLTPVTPPAWSCSAYVHPSRRSPRPRPGGQQGARRRMALRPMNGRAVWAPHPLQAHLEPERALAARLDRRRRRLAEDRDVASRSRAPRAAARAGRSLSVDLLAGVEDPGHVDAPGSPARSQGSASRQVPFMSAAPRPRRRVPSSSGPPAVERHRVEVTGDERPGCFGRAGVRATTLSPMRRTSRWGASASMGADSIGEHCLLAARRRDGDRSAAASAPQLAHVATP